MCLVIFFAAIKTEVKDEDNDDDDDGSSSDGDQIDRKHSTMIGRSATLHKDEKFHQQKTDVEEYDTLYSLILDCLNDKEMMIKQLIFEVVMKEKKQNEKEFNKLTNSRYSSLNVSSKSLRMDNYQASLSGNNGSINSTILSSLIEKKHLWKDRKELKK